MKITLNLLAISIILAGFFMSLPTKAWALADCNNPSTFMFGLITEVTLTHVTAEIHNYSGGNNPSCTGNIGIVSNIVNSGDPFIEIADQTFFAGSTTTIGPQQIKTLTVELPFCQGVGWQVDAFFGQLLNPYGPDYYTGRLLAGTRGQPICNLNPTPTPTPTSTPTPTPTPSPSPSPLESPSPSPIPISCAFTGPTSLKVGELGTFVSKSTGDITSSVWTASDGTPLSGLNSTFNWTPTLPGTQTLTLTVSGPSGQDACLADVAVPVEPSPSPSPSPSLSPSPIIIPSPSPSPSPSVSPSPIPISCAFTGPTSLNVGQVGFFHSVSTGQISSSVWTTSGGSPLSQLGPSFNWMPTTSGIQTLTLTVFGPGGEDACLAEIATVAPSPSPSLSPSPSPSPSESPLVSPSPTPLLSPTPTPIPSSSPQGFVPVIPEAPPVTGRTE